MRAAKTSRQHGHARWAAAVWWTLAIVGLLSMACTGSAARSSGSAQSDFDIVAYQGEGLLGGHHGKFSRVFEQGKPVILNFWAGLCPPCRAEMPAFQKLADEFQGKVIFVGVDVGQFTGLGDREDAADLLSGMRIRYPAAYAVDASPLRSYGVRAMPTTLFFTATGQVREKVEGMLLEDQIRSKIKALIGASS